MIRTQKISKANDSQFHYKPRCFWCSYNLFCVKPNNDSDTLNDIGLKFRNGTQRNLLFYAQFKLVEVKPTYYPVLNLQICNILWFWFQRIKTSIRRSLSIWKCRSSSGIVWVLFLITTHSYFASRLDGRIYFINKWSRRAIFIPSISVPLAMRQSCNKFCSISRTHCTKSM